MLFRILLVVEGQSDVIEIIVSNEQEPKPSLRRREFPLQRLGPPPTRLRSLPSDLRAAFWRHLLGSRFPAPLPH